MARTTEDIFNEIITAKEADGNLSTLSSTSKTAVWRLWAYITAFAIQVLETLFDAHRAEVLDALTQQKPHGPHWYRNMALAFQYGFNLIADTDRFDNTGATDEQIAASKIIKYSAVTEAQTESRLIVKIATATDTDLQPITPQQLESFTAYMEEIRDAGVKITVINYLPDLLQLTMKIYRDPLVIDANGISILNGNRPVEDAISAYMKNLPFNGELVLFDLAEALKKVEGVVIPDIVSAASKWIDPTVNDYGGYTPIDVRTIPESGYFKLENFDNISYVV